MESVSLLNSEIIFSWKQVKNIFIVPSFKHFLGEVILNSKYDGLFELIYSWLLFNPQAFHLHMVSWSSLRDIVSLRRSLTKTLCIPFTVCKSFSEVMTQSRWRKTQLPLWSKSKSLFKFSFMTTSWFFPSDLIFYSSSFTLYFILFDFFKY